ncbi:nicotinamide riboside transporter PnuC [Mucilaginibacter sp. HMF7410]|uniref:Nicotinamide riboside transporter PnuC n=2 Tax=Mucilaginibacter arboris TaxID=2682090 RepID=A0A7K1SS84_9SPHI|nr:nicotinamide riboside transporter PnuC [Mucilaginibacter arboris]
MDMQYWLQLLSQQILETGWLQWLAVVFGVAEVLLAKRNNVLLYPAGLIGTMLSIVLLLEAQLYAETLLNVYYIAMSVYGWWFWMKKRNQPTVPITYSNRREWIITALITFVGGLVLYLVLKKFTPSTVPVWDAFVSASAWAGTWLLTRRKIENWIVLNVSNLFAVPLLFYKQLPLFALLTIFLFVVAIFGYFDWKRIYRQQSKANSSP